MKDLCGRDLPTDRSRGGARLNFLIVMTIIVVLGYASYQLLPVFYRAKNFETFMQDTVNLAALTDKNSTWTEQQLKHALVEYDLPPDAVVNSTIHDGRLEARVQFTRTIPLVVTEYHYKFDKTVHSTTAVSGT
jgi:hypothetical protein